MIMKLEVQQPRNHRQTRLPVSKQDKDHREGGGGSLFYYFLQRVKLSLLPFKRSPTHCETVSWVNFATIYIDKDLTLNSNIKRNQNH